MAKIESYFNCDLKKAVQVQVLSGNVFSMDNNGNRICVRIFNDGEKATVTGSVSGRCILADGSTVNVSGGLTTANGQSVAYVDIPQGCLLIPGTLKITVQLTDSGVITTLAAILTTVYQTKTDNVITPSQQIINDWNAAISSALGAQDAQISALSTALTAEANARQAADTAEATARQSADNDLKSALEQTNVQPIDFTHSGSTTGFFWRIPFVLEKNRKYTFTVSDSNYSSGGIRIYDSTQTLIRVVSAWSTSSPVVEYTCVDDDVCYVGLASPGSSSTNFSGTLNIKSDGTYDRVNDLEKRITSDENDIQINSPYKTVNDTLSGSSTSFIWRKPYKLQEGRKYIFTVSDVSHSEGSIRLIDASGTTKLSIGWSSETLVREYECDRNDIVTIGLAGPGSTATNFSGTLNIASDSVKTRMDDIDSRVILNSGDIAGTSPYLEINESLTGTSTVFFWRKPFRLVNGRTYKMTVSDASETSGSIRFYNKNYELVGAQYGWRSEDLPTRYFVCDRDDIVYVGLAGPSSATTNFSGTLTIYSESIVSRIGAITPESNLPNYYFENDWLPSKIEEVKASLGFINGIAFCFITDTHFKDNVKNSKYLLKTVLDKTTVKNVFFGGDTISVYGSQDDLEEQANNLIEYQNYIGKDCFFSTRGNHDFYNRTNDSESDRYLSEGEAYNILCRNSENKIIDLLPSHMCYAVEKNTQNTVILMINSKDGTGTIQSYISGEQAKWIADELYKYRDKNIIAISHIPADSALNWYDSAQAIVHQLLSAFNNTNTVDITHEGTSITADYSGATGKVICHITGHAHMDEDNIADNVLSIVTTCDASYLDAGATRGTVTEQAFDVFCIDFDAGKINTVRIGRGNNREWEL